MCPILLLCKKSKGEFKMIAEVMKNTFKLISRFWADSV